MTSAGREEDASHSSWMLAVRREEMLTCKNTASHLYLPMFSYECGGLLMKYSHSSTRESTGKHLLLYWMMTNTLWSIRC